MHVTTGRAFDDRRNTSQQHAPSPHALDDARRALAALRRSDPALVRWVEDGYPTLTDAEHVARFGGPYERKAKRGRAA